MLFRREVRVLFTFRSSLIPESWAIELAESAMPANARITTAVILRVSSLFGTLNISESRNDRFGMNSVSKVAFATQSKTPSESRVRAFLCFIVLISPIPNSTHLNRVQPLHTAKPTVTVIGSVTLRGTEE